MRKEVRVFAPASLANLGVGYDILGLALDSPGDEVIVREGSKPGLTISLIKGDGGRLPYDIHTNTAGYAALQFLKNHGWEDLPIEMEIHKKMGMGTGLGSSAASAVAGVFGVNAYLDFPVDKAQLLSYAVEGEQKADGAYHADNVAPSLFGGITLIRSNETLDITHLPVPKGLCLAMIHPQIEILTSESRAILSPDVPLEAFIHQTGNIASFVAGLYTDNFELLKASLHDLVIEPQRAHLIPFFPVLKAMALESGALGFSISGAGPSMFAMCEDIAVAESIAEKAKDYYWRKGYESNCFTSYINMEGAKLITE
jgi:homoserine kinase